MQRILFTVEQEDFAHPYLPQIWNMREGTKAHAMPVRKSSVHLAGDVQSLQDGSSSQAEQERAHEGLLEPLTLSVVILQTRTDQVVCC